MKTLDYVQLLFYMNLIHRSEVVVKMWEILHTLCLPFKWLNHENTVARQWQDGA